MSTAVPDPNSMPASVPDGHASVPSKQGAGYRRDIDGLRALAILLVICYHYFNTHGGFVGVDIFFVISGYLISGIVFAELQAGQFSLTTFYARRIRRIFPALFLMLFACLFFGWCELLAGEYSELGQQAAAGAAYVSNFLFWSQSGYFDSAAITKPLLHLWSLGVEEQFYLLWPVLLMLAAWRKKPMLLVVGVTLLLSFGVNAWLVRRDASAAFYLPVTRFWELALGGLVAWHDGRAVAADRSARSSNIMAAAGFALLIAGVSLLNDSKAFPGWWALLPTLGTALLIAAGPAAWLNRRFFSARGMVAIGLISYPLYLWHWPLRVFAKLLFLHWSRGVNAGVLLASMVLAWLTYRFLERPCRRMSINRGAAGGIVAGGLVLVAVVAAFGVAAWQRHITPRLGNIDAMTTYKMHYEGCLTKTDEPFRADAFVPCESIDFPGRPVVLMVGDSHAFAVYQGLRSYFEQRRINILMRGVTPCPLLSLKDGRDSCVAYNRQIIAEIHQRKPDLVILDAYYLLMLSDPLYEEKASYPEYAVHRAGDLAAEGAKKVILLGEIPTWDHSLPWVLNSYFLRQGLPIPARTRSGVMPESLDMDTRMKQLALARGVTYFSLRDVLCNAGGCLTTVGTHLPDDMVVFDYGHLTNNGSSYLANTAIGPFAMQQLGLGTQ